MSPTTFFRATMALALTGITATGITATAIAAIGITPTRAMADVPSAAARLRHKHAAHRPRRSSPSVGGSAVQAGSPVNRGPAWQFIPGLGIPGVACNLPTSVCPNEFRDVQ